MIDASKPIYERYEKIEKVWDRYFTNFYRFTTLPVSAAIFLHMLVQYTLYSTHYELMGPALIAYITLEWFIAISLMVYLTLLMFAITFLINIGVGVAAEKSLEKAKEHASQEK